MPDYLRKISRSPSEWSTRDSSWLHLLLDFNSCLARDETDGHNNICATTTTPPPLGRPRPTRTPSLISFHSSSLFNPNTHHPISRLLPQPSTARDWASSNRQSHPAYTTQTCPDCDYGLFEAWHQSLHPTEMSSKPPLQPSKLPVWSVDEARSNAHVIPPLPSAASVNRPTCLASPPSTMSAAIKESRSKSQMFPSLVSS